MPDIFRDEELRNPFTRAQNPFDREVARERQLREAYIKGVDPREHSSAFVGPPQQRVFGMTRDEFAASMADEPEAQPVFDEEDLRIQEAARQRAELAASQGSLEDIRARNRSRFSRRPSLRDRFLASRGEEERFA